MIPWLRDGECDMKPIKFYDIMNANATSDIKSMNDITYATRIV